MIGRAEDLPSLPADFSFGVGTSDCQCEAFDRLYPDIRDIWNARRRLQYRMQATDFWNRYAEDIENARSLGCKIFRFSIAWTRVEPSPGQYRQEALDHYSDIVDAIRAAGMEAFVTLCHFTWPPHVEQRGGLIADSFPDIFATYAEKVVARMGDRVKYWASFNEPNILVFGYIKPWWERNYLQPPGLPVEAGFVDQVKAIHSLMRNLFLAHTKARTVIKARNPSAMVGANAALLGLPVCVQRFIDRSVISLDQNEKPRRGRFFVERPLTEHGRVDLVLALLTKTDSRASQLDFAEIYLIAERRVMVAVGSTAVSIKDLAGQRVAVVRGTTAQDSGSNLLSGCTIVPFANHDDAIANLKAGAVAAVVTDDTRLRPVMLSAPNQFRLLPEQLSEEPYGPAVTKGNPVLLDVVNKAVVAFIESGAWADSYRRNFGEPVPPPPRLPTMATLADIANPSRGANAVTGGNKTQRDLLSRIKQRGRIRVGVKVNVPGLGFRDQNGDWSGFEIDIARAIARAIFNDENAVEFVPLSTKDRIGMLRSFVRLFDQLFRFVAVLGTMSTTNWWNLGMAGKLPDFLCPRECVGQFDYIGVDYYWGLRSLHLSRLMDLVGALSAGRMEAAPVWPRAFYNWLVELGRMFPNHPLIVIENGCVENADGFDRADYLRRHIREVQRAVAGGTKIAAYLNWSITSNRELGHRFAPNTDFGLYHIGLDTDPALKRYSTPSAEAFKDIVQRRST